ncbi:MAG: U32 family peptidase [Deltaproteobacteria bacterium]|nr:U32 family peptidase [Deltaproteobacteria bacterium]
MKKQRITSKFPRTDHHPHRDPVDFPTGKPELLAPAGSPSTWAAALDAGADAVYLGLKSFSARAFAANFTLPQLHRIVDLTHERGARIFLAFNSLLKENELPTAVKTLDALTAIRPDALIIQDLGLLRLIKKYFPQFEVHASTLMAVHNLPGLTVLKGLGFDRSVLARELTLNEVERLAWNAPLGLELFIHGALCFSVSGLCLMSSFLGGQGSLRGACTQPCRRSYTTLKKRGFLFSPTDLESAPLFGRIRQIPLKALKIEGRMKGADYVSRVVKAYRWLLDASPDDLPEVLTQARQLIENTPGRRRSTGFLAGPRPADGLAPVGAATSGTFLGVIKSSDNRAGIIALRASVSSGDRLRIKFKGVDDQQAFTLKSLSVQGAAVKQAQAGQEATVAAPVPLSPGDLLFLVSSAQSEKEAEASSLVAALESGSHKHQPAGKASPAAIAALGELSASTGVQSEIHQPAIWFKVGRVEDLGAITKYHPDRLVVPLTTNNVKKVVNLRRRLEYWFDRLIWSLPPIVYDTALGTASRNLSTIHRLGARQFLISNLGHLAWIRDLQSQSRQRLDIYADYRLNCLNTQTETLLAAQGLHGVTLCLETDEENNDPVGSGEFFMFLDDLPFLPPGFSRPASRIIYKSPAQRVNVFVFSWRRISPILSLNNRFISGRSSRITDLREYRP